MTVREWLRARTPAPPARLAARVEEVLGVRCDDSAATADTACLDAAVALLDDLVARPTAGRESALDLLTVDALATYAFEAAADKPEGLEGAAARAMSGLSAAAAS